MGTALTAALALVALPGLVDSRSPSRDRPIDAAAFQQVTPEDEELMLISAHGQVIRTDTNTINHYSAAARGVIVMRLADGDKVVAIAAFRAGLAERGAIEDNDDPQPTGGAPVDPGR